MREIAAAGVGTVVVSWWGFDSPEHDRLLLVEEAATRHGLDVAIHVEPYRGTNAGSAAEDIATPPAGRGLHRLLPLRRRPGSGRGLGEALRAARDVRIFGHTTLVGTREGVGVRRALHLRRRHVERRALPAALRAGACGRAPVRAVGRPRVRRAPRDAPRGRPAAERRQTYDRMWKTAIRAERGHRHDHELQRVAGRNADRAGPRTAIGMPSYEGAWGKSGVAAQRAYLAATQRTGQRASTAARHRLQAPASVERRREPAAVGDRHAGRPGRDRGTPRARARGATRAPRATPRRSPRGSSSRACSGSSASRAASTSGNSPLSRSSSTMPAMRGGASSSSRKDDDGHGRQRTDELRHDPSVPERLDGRDALDPVRRGQPRVRIDVDLGERRTMPLTLRDLLLEHRGQRATRATPRGPEVDDDGHLARTLDDVASNVASVTSTADSATRPRHRRRSPRPAPQRTCSASTPRSERWPEVDVDLRPGLEPQRASADLAAERVQLVRGEHAAPPGLPPRDALELAELLERVDADVRVRADADRDRRACGRARQGGSRRRGRPPSSGRRRSSRRATRRGRAPAPSACVACTTVVRSRQAAGRGRAARSAGNRAPRGTPRSPSAARRRGRAAAGRARRRSGRSPRASRPGRRGRSGARARPDPVGAQLLDLLEVLGDGVLPEAGETSARIRDVEEDERDPGRLRRLGGRARFGDAQVVELADGRVAGREHLAIAVLVRLADELRRLPLGLREHDVAPRPEVAPRSASAQRALERVAVGVHEARKSERARHAGDATRARQ